MTTPKTDAQRGALHRWFTLVAEVLNDSGIDKRIVLHKLTARGINTTWTGESFKADVFKPVFEKVTSLPSTEGAETSGPMAYDSTIEGLNRWVAEEFGVVLPDFPKKEQG
jgi:hypothetical protein